MRLNPKVGAVVFAKDVGKVAGFYEKIISMPVKHSEPEKVLLESEAMLLVVHGIPRPVADSIHIAEPPQIRSEALINLFLPVSSLSRAREMAPDLACISHRFPAAPPDTLALTGRTRCRRYDVVSTKPSPPSTACTPP